MKYTKALVTAQAFDPKNGQPIAGSRDELIDLKDNVLFRECKTLTDISEVYQQFWNRFPTKQTEMVLVQKVVWA